MHNHNVTMLKMAINETPKAFNVNGITFSKKRLAELFPGWGCDIKTFYRLMIIMPFFATQKKVEEAPTSTGKYAIAKSKRIYETIGLDEGSLLPFMTIAAELGDLQIPKCLDDITEQCHDQICGCGAKISPTHLSAPKLTLH